MSRLVLLDTTGRTSYPQAALDELAGLPLELRSARPADACELLAIGGDVDLMLATALRFDAELLDALPRLKGLVRYGVGLDTIDLPAAAARGVEVRNVRDFCTEEIADHCLGLLLACARGLYRDAQEVRQGGWRRSAAPVMRLRGRCLGIVGLGAIGRALAARGRCLGMEILAHDPFVAEQAAAEAGARLVELPELLAASDFVSLNCSLSDATRHLIGAAELARMKPTAWLLNTARGGLVDQAALTRALRAGALAGAALDVLEREPPAADEPLLQLPNVLVTPHVAWYSPEAQDELLVGALRKIAELARAVLARESD